MTSDDRTAEDRPPDAVPGDDAQPTNQPIDEQVRTLPLDEGDGAERVLGQENSGPGNMEGGGEWPDPQAPATGPAPGTAEGGAEAIEQRRRRPDAGAPGGTSSQPQQLQDGGENQNVGPARSVDVGSGNQGAIDPPTGFKDVLEADRVAGGSSSVPDEG
ncbi:MAG: hypothetical protein M3N68_02770 [Actinomycetota bacterium]|nr:hypothetical protein [Actinomycetota bacterium]